MNWPEDLKKVFRSLIDYFFEAKNASTLNLPGPMKR
jgi:hypothetical protein